MEEEGNAHYALKIAVTILRERCELFQNRISSLEEENISLKSLCQKNFSNPNSLTEVDVYKQQIAAIEEHNKQLQNKLKIISRENQQLWRNLGKLTYVNKSMGIHLNKINDTLSEHATRHQPLIRSKTFTQDKPHNTDHQENLKDNEAKLDLEDISLKLMNSMTEVENEIDSLVKDVNNVDNITRTKNIITSSLGFSYGNDDDEENDDIVEDLKIILDELAHIKNESGKQNVILKENLKNIKNFKNNLKCDKCTENICEKNKPINSNLESIDDEARHKDNVYDSDHVTQCKIEKICPICNVHYSDHSFSIFLNHVEAHFKSGENDY